MKGLGIISLIIVFSACSSEKQVAKITKIGNIYFEKGQYKTALSYYSQLDLANPDSNQCSILRNRSLAHKALRNTSMSLTDQETLIKNCKTNKEDLLEYGKALMSSQNYMKAKKIFSYVQSQYSDSLSSLLIESCDSARIWIDKIPEYSINNLVEP